MQLTRTEVSRGGLRAWSRRRRPIVLGALLVLLTVACVLGFVILRPRPEWKTYRGFVEAFNAGDFSAQYRMLIADYNIPLLPEESLRKVLREMDPPFPTGMKLGDKPSRMLLGGARGSSALVAPIVNRGNARPATGQYPQTFVIAATTIRQRTRVRPYSTFLHYYMNSYGREAASRFEAFYFREAQRVGLWDAEREARRRIIARQQSPGN